MANLRANNLTGTGGRNALDGSVFFNGAGDYLSFAGSSDFSFGTGDFTVEWTMWSNEKTSDGVYRRIFSNDGPTGDSNGNLQFNIDESTGALVIWKGTSPNVLLGSANICDSAWHHVAVTRSGSTLKIFVDGVQDGSVSNSTDWGTHNSGEPRLYIGAGTESSTVKGHYKGFLSNFRILKGTALYTAVFTPPTEKLTVIPNTKLLCCQDSDDPTQEATGKTITAAGGLDINETEYVTNGTFGGSGTSPGGSTYSPAWTAWGDTTTAQNGGIFIERTSTLTGVYQLLTGSAIPAGQYRIRGTISNKTGPGSAIIRLSSAAFGNGTIFFGSYGPGVVESTVNYNGTSNLYLNLMLGNNTGSADFSNISFRQVYTADGSSNVLPPVGVDEGVVFEGETKHNTQSYMYFPTGDTAQRGRGTALFGGGYKTPNSITAIDYLSIQSGGLTQEWGNLSTTQLASGAALSSNTRYVRGGGWASPLNNNAIEYVTFTTSGNSLEFGDLTLGRRNIGSHSNDTRGLWAGGYISPADAGTDRIDYVTIASTGNAVDFGNLSDAGKSTSGTGSTTRAVFTLGNVAPVGASNVFEYVTIASAGDYTNFGDLEDPLRDNGTCSNGTRAVFAGGTRFPHNAVINTLQFITIASTGDTTNFGDLTLARGAIGGTSNGTRGVFMGGTTNPARQNTIDSIIIATTGEAVNWGEFRTAKQGLNSAASDSHGGLS